MLLGEVSLKAGPGGTARTSVEVAGMVEVGFVGMGRSEEQVALQPGHRPRWWYGTIGGCSQV